MQLITTLQIYTGKETTPRRYRFSSAYTDRRPIYLRVSGTPQQLAALVAQLEKIPTDQKIQLGFEAGEHPTGCTIHSKITAPIDADFAEGLATAKRQLAGMIRA